MTNRPPGVSSGDGHDGANGGTARPMRRRALLRRRLALAGACRATATAAAAIPTGDDPAARPPWTRAPGAPFSGYGQPSPHERAVLRRIDAPVD